MNAHDSLERRITDYYEREAMPRAPDRVLATTLETIESIPQRRVPIHVPWRFRHMHTFARVAVAAVVVIAVAAVGWNLFGPRSPSGVGGRPSASPSASPSPSFGATIVPESPPPLTMAFSSERHGFSLSYPEGWASTPATAPWLTDFPTFGMSEGDFVFHPGLRDHLFLVGVSRPLEGEDATQWVTDTLNALAAADECRLPLEPITIDGSDGQLCDPTLAATSAGDRGYIFVLYTSDDDPSAVAAYDAEFFRSILATVRLTPQTADDTPASPSASPS